MIARWFYKRRLSKLRDVSPTLRLVALEALPGSARKTRKEILERIRNTAGYLTDQASVNEAQYNLKEAKAVTERAAMENLNRMNAVRTYGVRSVRARPVRRLSNRSVSRWSEDQGYARRAVVILNQLLSSIGRTEVGI